MLITACISVFLLTSALLPRWSAPRWTKKFIEEPDDSPDHENISAKKPLTQLTKALFAVSLVGFSVQMTTIFLPEISIHMIYPAVSWAATCILVAVRRRATYSRSVLAIHLMIFLSQFAVITHQTSEIRNVYLSSIVVLLVAVIAIGISLQMPIRSPHLSKTGISRVGSAPTGHLRSPEDDLTVWQWMTVSWMSPLMKVGLQRQLNDDDIWSLSYEFQHKPLHDRFSKTKGSLLRRLLFANGLDFVIVGSLALLTVISSM